MWVSHRCAQMTTQMYTEKEGFTQMYTDDNTDFHRKGASHRRFRADFTQI